jgi:hypothetical protein
VIAQQFSSRLSRVLSGDGRDRVSADGWDLGALDGM